MRTHNMKPTPSSHFCVWSKGGSIIGTSPIKSFIQSNPRTRPLTHVYFYHFLREKWKGGSQPLLILLFLFWDGRWGGINYARPADPSVISSRIDNWAERGLSSVGQAKSPNISTRWHYILINHKNRYPMKMKTINPFPTTKIARNQSIF